MRRIPIVVIAVVLVSLVGGCGTGETKRAVDPRTEVLRFFGPDANVVALLRTDRPDQLAEVGAAIASLPGYAPVEALLRRAGLTIAGLDELVVTHDDVAGIGPAELAIGASSLVSAQPLIALDTEDEARLSRTFRQLRSRGTVRPAGALHDAELYVGAQVAFATRDGVLVASSDLARVREALETRDGDRDDQLDDGEVEGLLDELPEAAPVHVYVDFGALIGPDSALADETPWIAALGKGSLSLGTVGSGVELDAFARLDRESLGEDELPATEEFSPFSLSQALLEPPTPSAGDAPLRALLRAMAPVEGEVSASTDELRARIGLGP